MILTAAALSSGISRPRFMIRGCSCLMGRRRIEIISAAITRRGGGGIHNANFNNRATTLRFIVTHHNQHHDDHHQLDLEEKRVLDNNNNKHDDHPFINSKKHSTTTTTHLEPPSSSSSSSSITSSNYYASRQRLDQMDDVKWRSTTLRLLTQRPRQHTHNNTSNSISNTTNNLRLQWREARRTLDWWTRQPGGGHFCIALLDCMIQQQLQQQQQPQHAPSQVSSNSSNNLRDLPWREIVQRWALDWTAATAAHLAKSQQQQQEQSLSSAPPHIAHNSNNILTPAEFSAKLDQYRHVLGHLSTTTTATMTSNDHDDDNVTANTRIVMDPSLFEMVQKTAQQYNDSFITTIHDAGRHDKKKTNASSSSSNNNKTTRVEKEQDQEEMQLLLSASNVYQRLLAADGAQDADLCPDSFTINTMLRQECKKASSSSSAAADTVASSSSVTTTTTTTAAWAQGILHLMWTLFRNHGWHHVRPDHHTYTSVLQACMLEIKERSHKNYESSASSSSFSSFHNNNNINTNNCSRSKRMFELLEEMQQHSNNNIQQVEPGRNHYMLVLSACAQEGNSDTAQKLFDNLQERYHTTGRDALKPTGKLCSAFCSAMAKSPPQQQHDALVHVQAILDQMMQRYNADGDWIWLPTEHFWTSYLYLLTQSGDVKSIEKVEAVLLDNNMNNNNNNIMMIRPNRFHFGPVIRAWAKAGQPERAQALLEHMYNQFLQGHTALKPDSKVFLDVITAWKNSDCPHAQERATQLVEFMSRLLEEESSLVVKETSTLSPGNAHDEQKSKHGNHPKTGTPMDLLKMLSTAQSQGDAETAESILHNVMSLYDQGNTTLKPTQAQYNAVITAWSRTNERHAADRAEALLLDMLHRYDQGHADMEPSEHGFTAVMTSWSRSRRNDAGQRAQCIFDDMVQRYKGGVQSLRPTVKSYSALINAWARQGDASRAEFVLQSMLADFGRGGNEAAKPNIIAFNTVLAAWSRKKTPESLDRADQILRLMLELHDSPIQIKPDIVSFATVIAACLHANVPNKSADLAESYLQQAKDLYASGDDQCRPNSVAYGAVIQTIAKSDRHDAAEQAEVYLRAMLDLSDFDPRQVLLSYNATVGAWARTSAQNTSAIARAEALVKEMRQLAQKRRQPDCMPDKFTFAQLLKTISRSRASQADKAAQAEAVLDTMKEHGVTPDHVVLKIAKRCMDSVYRHDA